MPKKLDRLYIRVDAMFHRDERYLAMPYALRDSAYCLFELLNGWSRDKQTDGRVPLAAAFSTGLSMEHPRAKVARMIEALVAVGLLVRDGDELVSSKYAKWQDTREEIERASAAGRAGGKASGSARRSPSVNGSRTDRSTEDERIVHEPSSSREADESSSQTETETETETVATFASLTPPPLRSPQGDCEPGVAGEGLEAFLAELSQATGRPRRGQPSGKVRGLYLDRLRDGWTAEDIVAAARGAALSKHHMGLNDLQVPLNDAPHVLGSAMFDALVGLGYGEIGATRAETAEEQRRREIAEWARRADAGGLQA